MQRASHERTASRVTTSPTPTGRPVRALRGWCETASSAASDDAPGTEVTLSPAGTFAKTTAVQSQENNQRHRQLAIAIRQRIESRLPGRVRDLIVTVLDNTVVLEGRCATYYTKQLAQHAALGILDDEQLENLIVVGVAK